LEKAFKTEKALFELQRGGAAWSARRSLSLQELPRDSTFQVEIPILASAKKASGKKHVKKGCGWLISCSGETRRSVVQNNPAFFKKKLEQKGADRFHLKRKR